MATTRSFPTSTMIPAELPAPVDPNRGLDLCHPGLALRAVLLVQGALVLAVLFASDGWNQAMVSFGPALSAGLAGTLLWLASVCALQRRIAPQAPAQRGVLAALLGALAALTGWLPLVGLGLSEAAATRIVAVPLTGAGLAVLAWWWLEARVRSLRPAEASARLAELQSRIRPHFLFNALNTALALVQVDPPRAERVLEDLSELFRVALAEQNAFVTLDDEIELARRYLAIEQLRFGRRLQLSWDLDPAAGAARVPPLVLQPLVENAVRHGVEPAAEGGVIRVTTRVRRAQALIRIDNTVAQTRSQPGNGMALANVRERLRLMHDVAASFHMKRDAGWFRIQIVVPL